MPSGSATLLEATKSGDNQIARGIVETFVRESPIIEALPWTAFAGIAYVTNKENGLPTVAFRDVNETYTRSWGSDTQDFWGVAIMGGEVFVDNFLVDVTGSRESIKAKQFAKMAKAMAMTFDYYAFNGAGTSKTFKGLKTLISEGFGQSLTNSATGATISLDKLDEANDLFRNQGGADAIWLNRTVRRQITSKARTSVTGVSLIDVGTDSFGRQVTSWNGIPLTVVGYGINGSGTMVENLAFDEDPGDSTSDCSSLYLVKLGEADLHGLSGKNGSLMVNDFGETQAAPGHLGRIEWYPGICIPNQYSIVRVPGITAS